LTRRQANTIIAGIIAVILAQILCTAVLLRGQERTRKEAEAAHPSRTEARPTEAAPRPLVRPAHAPVIFDPVPVERPITR